MSDNCIHQVRPGSTFDKYEPKTPEQAAAKEMFLEIARQLRAKASLFVPSTGYGRRLESPFPRANLVSLWGGTGTGKTHLIEALINYLGGTAPAVRQAIYLSRKNFTNENIAFVHSYDDLPIVIIDDLYSEHQDIQKLNCVDVDVFMKWVAEIYESRRLVIMTSNFAILGDHGIMNRVKEFDKVGRATSRLVEMLAGAQEAHVIGPDHRRSTPKTGKVALF